MRLLWPLLACCARSPSPSIPASQPAAACASPEHRQFDFWIGRWDVAIHVRSSPTSETWAEARGTQHVESILGGCAISETFTAAGPGQPWAGRSYSSYQSRPGKWRQTWVDDQGSYLAFTGGLENGAMTLYGEPRTVETEGKTVQMRMVFLDVRPASLRWEWQRTDDDWKSSIVMMRIDYARTR